LESLAGNIEYCRFPTSEGRQRASGELQVLAKRFDNAIAVLEVSPQPALYERGNLRVQDSFKRLAR
jgi:hypothetical protein